MSAPPPDYAEIGITSNFSFLRGGSDPRAYVHQASELGIPVIGLADHNTLAGVVRAWKELDSEKVAHPPKLLIGARIVFIDSTPDILVYPRDRAAYGRLCQLLTRGKRGDDIERIEKGDCRLTLSDLIDFAEGQLLVLALSHRFEAPVALDILAQLKASAADGVWLAASLLYRGDDKRRLARLHGLATDAGVPLLATNEVLYHHPARRPLQDVLTCIREKTTIEAVGRRLEANAERHLKPAHEMIRLFRDLPDAIAETMRFAARISFSLDQLKYQYPDEPVPPGKTAQQHLEDLTWAGVDKYFGGEIDEKLRTTLNKELALIAELKYAHYFLTVHDIVHYARSQNILCQGRGSAANSAVCFVLGVTSVDPTKVDLLFERFISKERLEPPDIDVDFEHSRREEVMQYVYRRYGRHRAAIIATVIHYRPRSAIRDVGKALGLTEDVTAALADTVWGSWGKGLNDMQVRQAGLDPKNAMINLAVELATELIEFPRHLSQHVGGYVLTQDRLDTYVPIGNAAMDDRTFIEWDKDDVDALHMMKVDVLALGMLTCIRKCFDLIADHKGERRELATVPQDEEEVYDMLCRGESLGVFQVESRAQMNMLPRLRPQTFYDLVIEVAIVRPGPIQGDMVHPYLRRRNKQEQVTYPSPAPDQGDKDELYNVLHKTLGVPLFQEQAMRIAIEAAKFTSEEANGLRRSMATFRNLGTIGSYEEKLVGNMVARGYSPDFARSCFDQIKGFGSYGFPESHAASFAQLVYISSWLKHHHPDAFCCGLLNSQPMGFYAPAQIVGDARKNGVTVREVDVSHSFAQNTLEEKVGDHCAVRLGFRQIDGFHWLDEDEERLKQLQLSFRDVRSADVHESGRHERMGSLPPCGGELERGVSHDHRPCGLPLSLTSRASFARLGPRKGGGNPPTSRAALDGELDWADRIVAARNRRPFTSLEDFARDTGLPKRALILLADADAFRSLGLDRREALWAVRRLLDDVPLPLFEAATAREQPDEGAKPLPEMPRPEQVVADYQTIRLSLKGHPMEFLREMFTRERVVACHIINLSNDRRRVRCAGVVLVRQRPGSAKGVVFMTLEDETGIANIVVWPKVMEQYRKEVMGARLILVEGYIQSSPEGVTHLVAQRMTDRSHDLIGLANESLSRKHPVPAGPALIEPLNDDRRDHGDNSPQKIRHPRNVRILPPSRDFH
ncbi:MULTISPECIES: error-prone DNA polymerase [Bradyrhizobium]|uniref:Error-prone DNA polymerase n=1 Tax=Bradyrhizobium elkanii TaxID=29448 RepID=A0A8I1YEZ5_BRAEL|nr:MULTISPECIES: error-prone DNA polymerase [Bradyrhizobium]MBP1298903.1 error-prone DNA polymerase [Bradyrhizobium elkanii]MCP1930238.1 error-prone DNA polymerase [Bradyrhizobium elkanii]MCS3481504.1 error-prone DNA polymerase [Bradyrhizobium elkanii]MCS3579146.1 error-prone DNA polymerase [Bradyrhizobium elkanii]MCS3722019.1 error-prone DNA polymerase [Bradyrhizobium elkanii]